MDESVRQHKFVLEESEMPTTWYNVVSDLPMKCTMGVPTKSVATQMMNMSRQISR